MYYKSFCVGSFQFIYQQFYVLAPAWPFLLEYMCLNWIWMDEKNTDKFASNMSPYFLFCHWQSACVWGMGRQDKRVNVAQSIDIIFGFAFVCIKARYCSIQSICQNRKNTDFGSPVSKGQKYNEFVSVFISIELNWIELSKWCE